MTWRSDNYSQHIAVFYPCRLRYLLSEYAHIKDIQLYLKTVIESVKTFNAENVKTMNLPFFTIRPNLILFGIL
jgi:hypothetical protein